MHGLLIEKPMELETRIATIPGVVTVGLFALRPADVVIVAGAGGVKEI
ncbi:MAG TPA: ribose-5-phosphate isomerase A [Nevskiaceae bacterium]|nr:ribose-5-phosphate isomerase A [Nevskiaceae bacterium]